jgi:transcriptional regulator with XRE-family HTH domain
VSKLSPHQIFGRNVCRLRQSADLTQEQLAEKADISRTFLQEIEAGTKNPTVNIITRIKVALNAKWEQLLGS